ncbi:MAG: biosynthetic arginine decarboxylase [Phycisphaeraceae bacterium]|nr:biosynthetic arginine decarboxylase [Phycisphaeraceae bacterium]MBX3405151.1 biosynthetic arginine decarboxylase [Phycisphaeraceae bacterium]
MATLSIPKNAFLHGRWTHEDALRLYGMSDWGKGYFGVNARGHVTVMPSKNPAEQIDLFDLVKGLEDRGVYTPVLLRFSGVLEHRLREIRGAFDKAIADHNYQGGYSCVYPIKVNQQRHICEEIAKLGRELRFGLEAGSKPELLAVLALTEGQDDMPIVCNGFKDDEFIETVILATKLGRNIIPVVEKFSELELIVKHAERYNVRPRIGIRVKLGSRGAGRWESSAGARSKFGLFVTEVLEALEYLKARGMADCLNLLHCHVGSQLYDIRHLKNAVNELTHVYTELVRLGAGMKMLDIGGGMGVDYDGSQSAWNSSINYTVDEYAADVVHRIKTVCDDAGVPHPTIFSESGRAMVAYGSVLVLNVLGKSSFNAEPEMSRIKTDLAAEKEPPQPVLDLIDAYERINDRNLLEAYHDALQARDEAMSLFSLGYMSLPMRAASERLFWSVGRKVLDMCAKRGELPEEIEHLPETLSDIYFCNFSLFQSMPDSWAIDQLFPICPIHRLDEEPTRRGIMADITCDSDGKVDNFVDKRLEKKALELHELKAGEPYYLGVFLLGAYQEILGDLHNLLGDTHAVHVSYRAPGPGENGHGANGAAPETWSIDEVIEGDTVKEVLSYVQYDDEDMRRAMRREVERSIKANRLTPAEGKSFLAFYERGLDGYTYLEE